MDRFTLKTTNGKVVLSCPADCGEGYSLTSKEPCELTGRCGFKEMALERFAYLEDMIEQGELIKPVRCKDCQRWSTRGFPVKDDADYQTGSCRIKRTISGTQGMDYCSGGRLAELEGKK